LREEVKVGALHLLAVVHAGAEMLVAPHNVLEGGRDKKVLLLQAQLLAFEEVVVGVEDTGNVLQ
jgi:hypothetical protein